MSAEKPLVPNFTPVPNVVLEKLMPRLSKVALKILLAVARKTYGWGKERDTISLTQLQGLTGLGRAGVVRGIKELGALMKVTKSVGHDGNVYELNLEISTAELVSEWNWFQNGTSSKTVKRVVPKWNTQNKEEQKKRTPDFFFPIIKKIISRINELSGRTYRADSKALCKYLRARLKAGATEAECLAIVEDRWLRWGNSEKMIEHFNPVTLFREENFAKYLVEANANGSNGTASEDWRRATFVNA
jgi:phage replication O-like protein O